MNWEQLAMMAGLAGEPSDVPAPSQRAGKRTSENLKDVILNLIRTSRKSGSIYLRKGHLAASF
jgi:hypothetical protein